MWKYDVVLEAECPSCRHSNSMKALNREQPTICTKIQF